MIPHRLALIVLASIVASPAYGKSDGTKAEHEIDWWRTENAAVVSRIVDNVSVCSLFLYNNDNAVVISWGRDASVALSFNSTSWQFRSAEQIPVAVAIGDAWLGRAGQSTVPSLMATANQDWLSVSLQQSIDDLLPRATTITLKAPSHDLSFDIDRSKMSKLLLAEKRCRSTVISR
jgi:hypothetical protein